MMQPGYRRQALLGQLGGDQAVPRNTGITGIGREGGVQAPPIAPAPAAPPDPPDATNRAAGYDVGKWNELTPQDKQQYTLEGGAPTPPAAPAQKYGLGGGFNMDKVNDPTHQSAKYQIARVMQDFDPTKGVTPELINALNSRTTGKFHGEGDKLFADQGFDNLNNGTALDVVQGLKGGNGQWQYADMADNGGGPPQQAGGMVAPNSGPQIDGLLGGDPLAKIQAALGQYGGQRANLDALLKQLGG